MKPSLIMCLALAPALLGGCAAVGIEANHRATPVFSLEDYFTGETRAYGVFEDRSGKVVRTFSVVARGTQSAGNFILDERFLWSDGERQSRTWTFTRISDGRYRGTAADVDGEAMLETEGDAMRLRYLLRLPYKGTTLKVRFDDWSHMVADGVAINRADVSKYGVRLGRVTLTFIKPGHPSPTADMLAQPQ